MLVTEPVWDDYFTNLFEKTILNNRFIPREVKLGILKYPQQQVLLQQANNFKLDKLTGEIEINKIFCGGARYGGKTLMGAVCALQYMECKKHKTLVTRNTYDDLMAEGVDSIFGYIDMWNTQLDGDLIIREGKHTIKSKEGSLITFKSFNYDKKGDSLQSKSEHTIINDEAPQLSINILEDEEPTLRQGLDENYPLSKINFGNPQLNNEETNEYFADEYIDGDYIFINMDLHTNPLIDREKYKQSFKGLSIAKKSAFFDGDFRYKAKEGDLINQTQLNNALFDTSMIDYYNTASILFLDLAGRGSDKFCISTITIDLNDDTKILDNITQTKKANATKEVKKHMKEDSQRGVYPALAILEMEAGSWNYTFEYWYNMFMQEGIKVKDQKPVGNKYIRALPATEELITGELVINQNLTKKIYDESKRKKSYFDLFCKEAISMLPIMKVSPNIMDTVSLGVNYINNNEITVD